jgi:hypothetical protein
MGDRHSEKDEDQKDHDYVAGKRFAAARILEQCIETLETSDSDFAPERAMVVLADVKNALHRAFEELGLVFEEDDHPADLIKELASWASTENDDED